MIAVVDYGIGNLRSAEKALVRVGADARLVADPEELGEAAAVVLPGVGAFGMCARELRSRGFARFVVEAIESGKPFLGICIGFHLLYGRSEEDDTAKGLGLLGGTVRRLSGSVKLPHMQWNRLDRTRGREAAMLSGIHGDSWVYFVHSYAPVPDPVMQGVVATCDYGGPVVAGVEVGNVWATQFHPEKSGAVGLSILTRFVERCGEVAAGRVMRSEGL